MDLSIITDLEAERDQLRLENERLLRALKDACERMDRARSILTGGNPTEHNNWGMLDTSADRKALEVKP